MVRDDSSGTLCVPAAILVNSALVIISVILYIAMFSIVQAKSIERWSSIKAITISARAFKALYLLKKQWSLLKLANISFRMILTTESSDAVSSLGAYSDCHKISTMYISSTQHRKVDWAKILQ